jgi:two-component system chemotaxis response regulator CheB
MVNYWSTEKKVTNQHEHSTLSFSPKAAFPAAWTTQAYPRRTPSGNALGAVPELLGGGKRRTPYDIVALAASLGGLKALVEILSGLPPDFPAAITVVQHLAPRFPSMMSEILSRRTSLLVKQAESGDELRSGTVYIAPPNHHLLVNPNGILSLSQSERVNFVRPSADVLFKSVASSFKQRAIAVILTGRGNDGARGAQAITKEGGMVLTQDEATCESFSMPGFAIDIGSVDLTLPLNQIAFALMTLVMVGETETTKESVVSSQ